jgi:hypothetical protein
MRTRSFVLALALCAATPAAADDDVATIHVTPKTVVAGKQVRVHGIVAACPVVTLLSRAFGRSGGEFAGVPKVDAAVKHAHYSVKVRIPATKKPGTYDITGRCAGGNLGDDAHLTVTSATY